MEKRSVLDSVLSLFVSAYFLGEFFFLLDLTWKCFVNYDIKRTELTSLMLFFVPFIDKVVDGLFCLFMLYEQICF